MDDIVNFEQDQSILHTGRDSRTTHRTTIKTHTQSQMPKFVHVGEKAKHHLDRLKSRVGMQTHVAHPRPYRDVSSVKKDFELALQATKKLEMSHYSFDRAQKTGMSMFMDTSGTNFTRRGLGLDSERETRKQEEEKKFPLNNPVFNTLWEKLFANKNGGVRPLNKDEGLLMKKEDPLMDRQRLISRYQMANGGTYWKEQKDISAQKDPGKTTRNMSFDSALLTRNETAKTQNNGSFSKRSQVKKEIFKMVGFWATSNGGYPGSQKDTESTAHLMKKAFYRTDLLLSNGGAKSRGKSSGSKFGAMDVDMQAQTVHPMRDPKLRFESPSRKKYLAKMLYNPPSQTYANGYGQIFSSRIDDEQRSYQERSMSIK